MARKPSRGEVGERTHPCATTTLEMRRAIQASEEKNVDLAKRFGVNPKTISKWRWRVSESDEPMGPKDAPPRLLTRKDEAIILAYRWRTRLALNDCHDRLKRLMPKLSRSALYRCLNRYGLSKIGPPLSAPPLTDSAHKGPYTFEITTQEVVFHDEDSDDIRPVFLAVEEITKYPYAEVAAHTPENAAAFLAKLAAKSPQKIIMVTTNASPIFTEWPGLPGEDMAPVENHPFAAACRANKIAHTESMRRHTKPPKLRSTLLEIRDQYWLR